MSKAQFPSVPKAPRNVAPEPSALLATLAYFSTFRHALTLEELVPFQQFLHQTSQQIQTVLADLMAQGWVGEAHGYYYLAGDEHLPFLRLDREQRAESWSAWISGATARLQALPFVSGLAISGSLSKGTQDECGDIDFFMVTPERRLWWCHAIQGRWRKLLSADRQKHFCINYRIAENALMIPRRDLFTATEIVFLKPVWNHDLFQRFWATNDWVRQFYPAWVPPESPLGPAASSSRARNRIERMLSGAFGDWGERVIHRMIMRRVESRTRWEMRRAWGMELTADVCKMNNADQSERTRLSCDLRIRRLEAEHHLHLVRWAWTLEMASEPEPRLQA
ncbi:MAG: hypothetical protein LWX11_10260 [Firmicutes bacterium]|nr:hypothetical protein [Bacillota bacterium]